MKSDQTGGIIQTMCKYDDSVFVHDLLWANYRVMWGLVSNVIGCDLLIFEQYITSVTVIDFCNNLLRTEFC